MYLLDLWFGCHDIVDMQCDRKSYVLVPFHRAHKMYPLQTTNIILYQNQHSLFTRTAVPIEDLIKKFP